MRARVLCPAIAAALLMPATASAQSPASHYAARPWEANFHLGALLLDDEFTGEETLMVGARIVRNWPSGWGIGGNFDYAEPEDRVDLTMLSGEVDYTFGSRTRAHFFVGLGLGVAIVSLDDDDDDDDEDDDDSESELLVPLVVGVKWFQRTRNPFWALRGELRDNIIRFDQADRTTHNVELSGGISIFP